MTNKIGKTSYPEIIDILTQMVRFDDDATVKLTKFQYVEWTTTRSIYVPANIEEDGVFYHAGCRYELPRHLVVDTKLYTRTTHNIYKKDGDTHEA